MVRVTEYLMVCAMKNGLFVSGLGYFRLEKCHFESLQRLRIVRIGVYSGCPLQISINLPIIQYDVNGIAALQKWMCECARGEKPNKKSAHTRRKIKRKMLTKMDIIQLHLSAITSEFDYVCELAVAPPPSPSPSPSPVNRSPDHKV